MLNINANAIELYEFECMAKNQVNSRQAAAFTRKPLLTLLNMD